MTPSDRPAIDDAVDAIIAGDAASLEANDRAESRRAANLLMVHGLLVGQAGGEALQAERAITQALARVRGQTVRSQTVRNPGRRVILRRTFPLAAAIAIAAGATMWYLITSEHRAVATLASAHQQQGPRRYRLVIQRTPEPPAVQEISGTYDVDGAGRCVVTIPLPTQSGNSRVVFGCCLTEWWIVTPSGALERGPDRGVVLRWIRAVAGDAPFPSIDATLATLEDNYDVSIDAQTDGGDHYHAIRTNADAAEADVFELTLNRETRKVRHVRWTWREPVGSIAQLISVEGVMLERRPFPPGWFEPDAHRVPERDE